MSNTVKLSVVIPCYKDSSVLGRNLPVLKRHLDSQLIPYEVVVVDDGSGDADAACKVADSLGCRFYTQPKNMGKGAAVRRGMREARGEFRIFTDVDIPFELDAFDRFLHYLDFKEFDVVVGDRNLPGSRYMSEISAIRRIGSSVFAFLSGRFVAGGYFDTQCGMKGFRASAANDLFSVARINRFGFDVELLYIAMKRNYDIKKLAVILRSQEGSSVNVVRDGLQMVFDLFRIVLHQGLGFYKKRE